MMTGFAAELNQPNWAVRYGFFQMPRVSNGMAQDQRYLDAWGMVTELERRYALTATPAPSGSWPISTGPTWAVSRPPSTAPSGRPTFGRRGHIESNTASD